MIRKTTDVNITHYYKINVFFLKVIGTWFYHGAILKLCLSVVPCTAFITLYWAEFNLIVKQNWGEKTLIETVPHILTCMAITVKFFGCQINNKNLEQLFKEAHESWSYCYSKKEHEVMADYASKGRLITIYYAWYIYVTSTLYCGLTVMPNFVSAMNSLNKSLMYALPYPGDYNLDLDTYYSVIAFHMAYNVFVGMTVLIANDTMFMISIQHCCSLFAIVGYRLEHTFPDKDDMVHWKVCEVNKMYNRNMIRAINAHQRAIAFSKLIETTFSTMLLLQVGIVVLCLTFTMFRILLIIDDDKPDAMRYVAFGLGQFFHIFSFCYSGQVLTNHSNESLNNAIRSEWYKIPTESQKLLVLLVRRSLEPSFVSAGKIFIFNLENFATLVQTSVSYFMVLSSTH